MESKNFLKEVLVSDSDVQRVDVAGTQWLMRIKL